MGPAPDTTNMTKPTKIIRRIDLGTLRDNPDAGRQTWMIPGRTRFKELYDHGDKIEIMENGFTIEISDKPCFVVDRDFFQKDTEFRPAPRLPEPQPALPSSAQGYRCHLDS